MPFYRIDPLKIDFARVADVVSANYATRFNILPVALTPTKLVIATAEPFRTEWQTESAKITRRNIRVVISKPLDIDSGVPPNVTTRAKWKDWWATAGVTSWCHCRWQTTLMP